jgi:hypothetical protein
MPALTRAALLAQIAALIADAPAGNISALDLRTTLINADDSNLNKLTDTSDVITEGAIKLLLTTTERSRIAYEWQTALRTAPADFTPGVTTIFTMPAAAPGNDEDYVKVYFDGVDQSPADWSISGTTLTFISPPPVGVAVVKIQVLA